MRNDVINHLHVQHIHFLPKLVMNLLCLIYGSLSNTHKVEMLTVKYHFLRLFERKTNIFLGKILKLYLPIMVKVRPSLTGEPENQFTIMLVLDKDNHINSPPLPNIDGVSIYHQAEQIFYAKRFGGFAKEADWKRESSQLLELCKTLPINREEVISASYDMPTKLFNRHNEVLVAEMIENENTSNETTIAIS